MGDIAVSAPTVEEEEAAWTRMLDRFAGLPDIEVRVRCNPDAFDHLGPAFPRSASTVRGCVVYN